MPACPPAVCARAEFHVDEELLERVQSLGEVTDAGGVPVSIMLAAASAHAGAGGLPHASHPAP